MSHLAEVHIGDRGTVYQVIPTDQGGPVDPTDATVAQIIFRLPQGGVVVKDATVIPEGSPATSWSLQYIVTEGDGIGSPPGEFHLSSGRLLIQAYLAWADGSRFHSSISQVADDGMELRVYKNLRAMNDANEFES